jgi:pyruvate/2-oxoglutarate/acetoin dehydrogenase E1 component
MSQETPTIARSETVKMTGAEALGDALDLALARDPRVIILGEDVADPAGGIFKVTKGLSTKHGKERVLTTPIAEA